MVDLVITGGSGQVATALAALAPVEGLGVRLLGRPGFDFDRAETLAAVFDPSPAMVVNAAAYTAVDRAETEPEAAGRANTTGPALLAGLCRAHGCKFLHISTDYVFDGTKPAPYRESDAANPTGVYGRSKYEGEVAVMAANPDAIILRTAWVYAATGRNFLLTMLSAARRLPTLRVVADQVGCPTLAADLAAAILRIATAPDWRPGIYHAAGTGQTSWHGFATAILRRAASHGLPCPEILPIATADWPTPAKRPENSRLDCTLLESTFGLVLPSWTEGVIRTVDAVMTASSTRPRT